MQIVCRTDVEETMNELKTRYPPELGLLTCEIKFMKHEFTSSKRLEAWLVLSSRLPKVIATLSFCLAVIDSFDQHPLTRQNTVMSIVDCIWHLRNGYSPGSWDAAWISVSPRAVVVGKFPVELQDRAPVRLEVEVKSPRHHLT